MLGSGQGNKQIPCPLLCSFFEASIGANGWNMFVEGKKAHLQTAGCVECVQPFKVCALRP